MKVRMDELEKDETHGNIHALQVLKTFYPKFSKVFFFLQFVTFYVIFRIHFCWTRSCDFVIYKILLQ